MPGGPPMPAQVARAPASVRQLPPARGGCHRACADAREMSMNTLVHTDRHNSAHQEEVHPCQEEDRQEGPAVAAFPCPSSAAAR